jgi:hypothetical protein
MTMKTLEWGRLVFEMWMRRFDLLVNATEHKFEKCGSPYSRESDFIN